MVILKHFEELLDLHTGEPILPFDEYIIRSIYKCKAHFDCSEFDCISNHSLFSLLEFVIFKV